MNDKASHAKGALGDKTADEIVSSPEFKALVARRWAVSVGLTLALFVLYYGYILLIAVDKPLMATKVGEFTTLAIPLGVGVILGAWALTAIYVAWENAAFDPKVEHFKKSLRNGDGK